MSSTDNWLKKELPNPEEDEDAYNRDACRWLMEKLRLSEMLQKLMDEEKALHGVRQLFELYDDK